MQNSNRIAAFTESGKRRFPVPPLVPLPPPPPPPPSPLLLLFGSDDFLRPFLLLLLLALPISLSSVPLLFLVNTILRESMYYKDNIQKKKHWLRRLQSIQGGFQCFRFDHLGNDLPRPLAKTTQRGKALECSLAGKWNA
jgi:hypothetical protein